MASRFVDVDGLVGDLGFDPHALRERYREERDKRLRPEGARQYQRMV